MGLTFNGTEIGSDIKINGNEVQNLKMGTSDVWSGRVKIPSTPINVKYACMLNNKLHIFGTESSNVVHYYLDNNNWVQGSSGLTYRYGLTRSQFTVLNGFLYFCDKMTIQVTEWRVSRLNGSTPGDPIVNKRASTMRIYLKKYNHTSDSFETIVALSSSETIPTYQELKSKYPERYYYIYYNRGTETTNGYDDFICPSSSNSILLFKIGEGDQAGIISTAKREINLSTLNITSEATYLSYRGNSKDINFPIVSCGFCKNFDSSGNDLFDISRSVFALEIIHYSDYSNYKDICLFDGSTNGRQIVGRDVYSTEEYFKIFGGLSRYGTGGSPVPFILTRYGDYIYTQSFYRRSATATSITADSYTLWDNKPTISASEMIVIKNQLVVFGTNKKTASFNGTDWWYST